MPVSISWRENLCELRLNAQNTGNAMSAELVECLHDALDEAEKGGACLVGLSASGRHFCTGFDLTDVEAETDASLLHRFVRIEMLLARLRNAPFATLAYAHGAAIGAGADLYIACTRRYCAPATRFGFPGAGFGLMLGTGRLCEIVGASTTQELVSSGRLFAAEDSLSLGITTAILEPDAFKAVLDEETARAKRLDTQTLSSLRSIVASETTDRDLAVLVRSAVRPGLRERILEHRARAAGNAARRPLAAHAGATAAGASA